MLYKPTDTISVQCRGAMMLWLGIRKSIQPVKKLVDEVLAWLSICSEVQIICIYGPADATATPSSLAPLKSRLV